LALPFGPLSAQLELAVFFAGNGRLSSPEILYSGLGSENIPGSDLPGNPRYATKIVVNPQTIHLLGITIYCFLQPFAGKACAAC
jgi:hypothetical protein